MGREWGVCVPVRRGGARRLGLRLPPYPAGLITFPGELSDEAIAEFVQRWQTSHGQVGAHQVRLLLDNRQGTFTPSEPLTFNYDDVPVFRPGWLDAERMRAGIKAAAPRRTGSRQLVALVAYAVVVSFVVLVLSGALWVIPDGTVGGVVWVVGLVAVIGGGALLGRVLGR